MVAANRDEDFSRPASAAAFWTDDPDIVAGRDLSAGGTWLGATRSGRFAAITNFRNPADRMTDAPSRGALVADFLRGRQMPAEYLARLQETAQRYNGFSLLVGDGNELWCFSNRGMAPRSVEPGVHGLSNHLLDTPWPKVRKGVEALEASVRANAPVEQYFALLEDTQTAAEDQLPDTGVGPERERWLSSIRLSGGPYGTRCSTVFIAGRDGNAQFHERTWAVDGHAQSTTSHRFTIAPPGV